MLTVCLDKVSDTVEFLKFLNKQKVHAKIAVVAPAWVLAKTAINNFLDDMKNEGIQYNARRDVDKITVNLDNLELVGFVASSRLTDNIRGRKFDFVIACEAGRMTRELFDSIKNI
jgi:hypothetical protein